MPVLIFPTRRTGRGAALTAARLVLGLAVVFVLALAAERFLTSGAAVVVLVFGGPLAAIVVFDERRARRRDRVRRVDRLAAAAIREREAER